jgi:hypothetical protein
MEPDEDFQDSGPFCRHWDDLCDCDEVCGNCGHKCCEHDQYDPGECNHDGCGCAGWREPS